MNTLRYLTESIKSLCFSDQKMAFLSGPRQCGKTTLARMLIAERPAAGRYYNWDDISFRRIWVRDPSSTVVNAVKRDGSVPLVAYDEIHKARGWKRTLKGIYDTREAPVDIVVTGSARLNVFMKGGDSLVGRYYHFRMHPFSVGELCRTAVKDPHELLRLIGTRAIAHKKQHDECFAALMRYGAFPEPFLAQNERKARLWRTTRIERVIREDLRDISRIPELSRVEILASLIPERVGSPLSLNSLREDLEVGHETVKRWIGFLKELYYVFEVRPYSRSIARSLRKEPKLYLWDFSEVADSGPRFENCVALHLLKACHFWSDNGYGAFELHYLRNKEKQEIDFLLTCEGKPWLAVEVKVSDTEPSHHWDKFISETKVPLALQVVEKPGVWKVVQTSTKSPLIIASASEILPYFV